MSLAIRIVDRYLTAKAVSFQPEFKKAFEAYGLGDAEPARDLINKVLHLIDPERNGTFAPWFYALGTTQRNKMRKLFRNSYDLLDKWLDEKHMKSETWKPHVLALLESWGKQLRTLETLSKAEDEDRIIQRGGFSIIPMPGISKTTADTALEALDAAASKIRPKFPNVLYGKVFFATSLGKSSARYISADDTIHLSTSARRLPDDVYSLIHEFGHRFDHKFFSTQHKELRQQFWQLSMQKEYETVVFDAPLRRAVAEELVTVAQARKEGKPFLGISTVTEQWAKQVDIRSPMSAYMSGKLDEEQLLQAFMGTKDVTHTTNKLLHGPLAVTPYGATKPTENFAEAFAHYVLGMKMPQEFVDIFTKL